jgi:hypothetical protein
VTASGGNAVDLDTGEHAVVVHAALDERGDRHDREYRDECAARDDGYPSRPVKPPGRVAVGGL